MTPTRPSEAVLHHHVHAVGVVLHAVHVLARTVEVLAGHLAARRERIEDVAEDILPLLVLVVGVIAVAALHADGRIAARNEQARRAVDLPGVLPAPHRHHAHERRIFGIGREVEPRAREVLDVGGDALAIDTVHEEPQRVAAADRAAELHAPAQQRGVVLLHHVQFQLLAARLRKRCAEYAAALLEHEIHDFGGYFLRRYDEVAFVFAVFVIDDDHYFAVAEIFDNLFHTIQNRAFCHFV